MGMLSTALAVSGQAFWKEEKSTITRASEIKCMVRKKREKADCAYCRGGRTKLRAGESGVPWERNKDDKRCG